VEEEEKLSSCEIGKGREKEASELDERLSSRDGGIE